jgi:hypothetical protein
MPRQNVSKWAGETTLGKYSQVTLKLQNLGFFKNQDATRVATLQKIVLRESPFDDDDIGQAEKVGCAPCCAMETTGGEADKSPCCLKGSGSQ